MCINVRIRKVVAWLDLFHERFKKCYHYYYTVYMMYVLSMTTS